MGDLDETERLLDRTRHLGLRVQEVHIAPLSAGWTPARPDGFVRGACVPIETMATAKTMFAASQADVIVIRGVDPIRSAFASNKGERDRLMEIYGPGETFLRAYTRLGHVVLERNGISTATFRRCSESLFENHWRVWAALRPDARRPPPHWFEPVSTLYRGVDCANPSVDFSGCLVVASEEARAALGVEESVTVRVISARVDCIAQDGLEAIDRIASYSHLEAVVRGASTAAGIDFRSEFLARRILLEAYTCYPIVPIAFLLRSGLVSAPEEIPAFLEAYPITVSGGLNLAKAAWNCTTLSALVQMVHRLRTEPLVRMGAIHSLAALGYKQGLALLEGPRSVA